MGNGMLLNDVPPPAIDALAAYAGHGSGSPLLSVELRHLGGAVAERPAYAGAVGHFNAEFAMFAVGVTPDLASAGKVDAYVQLVEQALAPWSASIHYANFDDRPEGGRDRFHDRATLEHLGAVKSQVDPTALHRCSCVLNPCTRAVRMITLRYKITWECLMIMHDTGAVDYLDEATWHHLRGAPL
jgi:hypothetical protein